MLTVHIISQVLENLLLCYDPTSVIFIETPDRPDQVFCCKFDRLWLGQRQQSMQKHINCKQPFANTAKPAITVLQEVELLMVDLTFASGFCCSNSSCLSWQLVNCCRNQGCIDPAHCVQDLTILQRQTISAAEGMRGLILQIK